MQPHPAFVDGVPNSGKLKESQPLEQLDAIDFDAFVALARGEPDTLLGFQNLDTRPPQSAGMHIDVAAAIVSHDEAEALLIVEEFHLAFSHRAAGTRIAITMAATPKPVTATKAIPASETVMPAAEPVATMVMATSAATKAVTATAAKTVAATKAVSASVAEIATGLPRRGLLGRARIDTVDCNYLKAAGRILQIADDCGPLKQTGCTQRRERRGMTKGVRTVIQCDEPVSFCRVEPLDRTFHRSSCERSRTAIVVICHKSADATPWPDSFPQAHRHVPATGSAR